MPTICFKYWPIFVKSVDQQKCTIASWYQWQPSNSYFYASFMLNQSSCFDFEYCLVLSVMYCTIWTGCAELTLFSPKRDWSWCGGCIFHPSSLKTRACACESELGERKPGRGGKHWIREYVHINRRGAVKMSSIGSTGQRDYIRANVHNIFLYKKAKIIQLKSTRLWNKYTYVQIIATVGRLYVKRAQRAGEGSM